MSSLGSGARSKRTRHIASRPRPQLSSRAGCAGCSAGPPSPRAKRPLPSGRRASPRPPACPRVCHVTPRPRQRRRPPRLAAPAAAGKRSGKPFAVGLFGTAAGLGRAARVRRPVRPSLRGPVRQRPRCPASRPPVARPPGIAPCVWWPGRPYRHSTDAARPPAMAPAYRHRAAVPACTSYNHKKLLYFLSNTSPLRTRQPTNMSLLCVCGSTLFPGQLHDRHAPSCLGRRGRRARGALDEASPLPRPASPESQSTRRRVVGMGAGARGKGEGGGGPIRQNGSGVSGEKRRGVKGVWRRF